MTRPMTTFPRRSISWCFDWPPVFRLRPSVPSCRSTSRNYPIGRSALRNDSVRSHCSALIECSAAQHPILSSYRFPLPCHPLCSARIAPSPSAAAIRPRATLSFRHPPLFVLAWTSLSIAARNRTQVHRYAATAARRYAAAARCCTATAARCCTATAARRCARCPHQDTPMPVPSQVAVNCGTPSMLGSLTPNSLYVSTVQAGRFSTLPLLTGAPRCVVFNTSLLILNATHVHFFRLRPKGSCFHCPQNKPTNSQSLPSQHLSNPLLNPSMSATLPWVHPSSPSPLSTSHCFDTRAVPCTPRIQMDTQRERKPTLFVSEPVLLFRTH